jgi:putative acetyltransferase
MIEETEEADEKYVCKKNSQVVGFITARKDGYILELYVKSRFQGQRVGTCLLERLRENHNCLSVSVYKHNVNAVNFYKKKDFVRETDKCKPCSLTGFEKYRMKWP